MIDLSVIVPVYNMAGDGKLNYSLDSLVNQTMRNMEIIAVDDKSTDNSLDILKDYEKRYPGRVRVIASPENRRQGLCILLRIRHRLGILRRQNVGG